MSSIEQRIMAFERKCCRKLPRIGWTQKVTNTDLYSRIKLKENIMQKLIGRKLRLFELICRIHNSRRIKELMFEVMESANRRGKPHREWLDNITEWGNASLQELSQAAMDKRAGRVRSRWRWTPRSAEPTVLDDDDD